MRRAFSYARFSDKHQGKGRSMPRQDERVRAYCERRNWALDERLFRDPGISAFTGANSRRGDLAEFLRLVEDGRVPQGSVLIIENVDRFSRLEPDEATALFMSVVNAGC